MFSRTWASLRYRLLEGQWAQRLRTRLRRPSLSTQTDRNIWYLYVEVFWAAIFSAVFSFNATYALRLGASNQMVGWLSSLPSLFAMVLMIPAARFLETKSERGPWLYVNLIIGRAAFLGAALIPWLFRAHQAEVLVWLFILRTIPITLFNTGFSPMLADVIPERDRARVFANRNIIVSATTAAATFLAGKWLDAAGDLHWAAFPLNYQVLYFIGAAGALTSAYFVSKIQAPPTEIIARQQQKKQARFSTAQLKDALRGMFSGNRAFVRIVINTLIFNLGAWLVMPLYTILFVKNLGASDGWIGTNATLANLGVIAGYALWQRVIQKFGEHNALLWSIIPSASYAFLVALFPNLTLILLWGILINLINPGVNLSHNNIFYSLCPEKRRASYMALYSSIMNAGAFIGPMLGVALAEIWDIRWVLVIGGVIRLAGAIMFHIWKISDTPIEE